MSHSSTEDENLAIDIKEKEGDTSESKLMGDEEEAKTIPVPNKSKETSENKKGNTNECGECSDSSNCNFALDIVAIVCIFLMSIFFLCGATFVHPGTYFSDSRPDDPFAFILVGTLFYIAFCSIDVVKRKSKGLLEIVAASVSILGGVMWFIASIFLLDGVSQPVVWGGIWITGCLINLYVYIYDLVIYFRGETKPLFLGIALFLGCLVNLMFMGGAGSLIEIYNSYNVYTIDFANTAGALISGSIMYLIYSAFFTLSIFKKNVLVTIH